MVKKIIKKQNTNKLTSLILCLLIFFTIKNGHCIFYYGDTVTIESVKFATMFLQDDGSSNLKLFFVYGGTNCPVSTQWKLTGIDGKSGEILSAQFANLQNIGTTNYISFPSSTGTPLVTTQNSGAADFFALVPNPNTTIDNIASTLQSSGNHTAFYTSLNANYAKIINNGDKFALLSDKTGTFLKTLGSNSQIAASTTNNGTNLQTLWYLRLINSPVTTKIKADFTSDLAKLTTPLLLNTLINSGASTSTKIKYNGNAATFLIDYPSATTGIFAKIQSFFTNNIPNITGQNLIDLKTLLSNTNLSKFLSSTEQTTVATLLKNLLTSIDFISDLNNTTTLSQLNTLITTGASINSKIAYNTVTYLTDYPSATTGIFAKIQSFFTNNQPNVLGQSLIDLKTLLSNTMLQKFLTTAEKATVTNLLATVNAIITNQSNFTTDLNNNAASPIALLNNIINNSNYNSVSYFVDYPATDNSVFTKIIGFFIMGSNLDDIQALLNNQNLSKFLSTTTVKDQNNNDTTQLKMLTDFMTSSRLSAELNRVNNVFYSLPSDYDGMLAALQNLVTSVATNNFDYTQVQAIFFTKLQALHALRPTTDIIKLSTLQAWYNNLITPIKTKLIDASADINQLINQVNADINTINFNTEITRVNGILSNFTAATNYDSKFAILKDLVGNVKPNINYISVQISFWTALNNLHTARSKTDKTKLQALQDLYKSLITPNRTPLLAATSVLDSIINDITTDINKIKATSGATATIEQQFIDSINAAITKPAMIDKIKALNTIVATSNLRLAKTTDITDATRKLFAEKIMASGGTLIAIINAYATKISYTAEDKINIKKILSANASVLGNITNTTNFSTAFKSLLNNAVKTNLLSDAAKNDIKTKLLKTPLINLQKNITKLKTIK